MEVGRVIGEGQWGFVNEVTLNGVKYALKQFHCPDDDVKVKGCCCSREIDISLRVGDHPNVCNVISVVDVDTTNNPNVESKALLLEYCPNNLGAFLRKIRQPTERNYILMKVLFVQMLMGLEYIHSKNVYHNDIKMDNVLIADDDDGNPIAKICDFGLSSFFPVPGCAACCYRPPEVCSEKGKFTNVSDVFSLGCVFYEMISGKDFISLDHVDDPEPEDVAQTIIKQLNITDTNIIKKVLGDSLQVRKSNRRGNVIDKLKIRKEFGDEIHIKKFKTLLKGMLEFDPDKRLNPTSALDSEYFSDIKDLISYQREENLYPKLKEMSGIKVNVKSLDLEIKRVVSTIRAHNREWNEILKMGLGIFMRYCNGCHPKKKYFTHCIYLAHKYIAVLDVFYDWVDIFPDSQWDKKIEDDILKRTKFNIYHPDSFY